MRETKDRTGENVLDVSTLKQSSHIRDVSRYGSKWKPTWRGSKPFSHIWEVVSRWRCVHHQVLVTHWGLEQFEGSWRHTFSSSFDFRCMSMIVLFIFFLSSHHFAGNSIKGKKNRTFFISFHIWLNFLITPSQWCIFRKKQQPVLTNINDKMNVILVMQNIGSRKLRLTCLTFRWKHLQIEIFKKKIWILVYRSEFAKKK